MVPPVPGKMCLQQDTGLPGLGPPPDAQAAPWPPQPQPGLPPHVLTVTVLVPYSHTEE